MNTFIDLLKSSSLIQGTITLVCILVMAFLIVTGKPVPDILANLVVMILGYYFGTKTQQLANKEAKYNATSNGSSSDPGAN